MIDTVFTNVNWFDAFAQVGMGCSIELHMLDLGETRIAVYRAAERITAMTGERFALAEEIAARLNLSEAGTRAIGEELCRAGFFEQLSRLGSSEARGYRAIGHDEWAARYLGRCWSWEARPA